MDFLQEAIKIEESVVDLRRKLHEIPELGLCETQTQGMIKDYLKNHSIPFYTYSKTGIAAIVKGTKNTNNKGRVVALRSDMDALPIIEENNLPFKSKNTGIMHACGHDGHMAILLGAATILNQIKNTFTGYVKFIFEPAEETVGGSRFMIEEGILDNPKVDAIFGLHVSENLDTSKIMLREGYINASSNPFEIEIIGKGGHGAAPDKTVDPIVVSAEVIIALQTIVSRKISPKNPVVITVGSIHGGSASNVIPDKVIIKGIIRTTNEEDRKSAKENLIRITENICLSSGAKSIIKITDGYPSLYNSEEMCLNVINSAKKIIGSDNITNQPKISMGVESFAYFTLKVPGCFYYLGTRGQNDKYNRPAHSSKFDIDEAALKYGVAIQCQIAYDFLVN